MNPLEIGTYGAKRQKENYLRSGKVGSRRKRFPQEFAQFRLSDGRHLGEVLGRDFFELGSNDSDGEGSLAVHQETSRKASHSADRSQESRTGAMPAWARRDRDSHSENSIGAVFRPDGRDQAHAWPNLGKPNTKRDSGGNMQDRVPDDVQSGHVLKLPLTLHGAIEEDSLVPGSVYRIPKSAGGGISRWTNGLFYPLQGGEVTRALTPHRINTRLHLPPIALAAVDGHAPAYALSLPITNGRIDRDALRNGRTYLVAGADGVKSAWLWDEEDRAFIPYRGSRPAFSIDGMHELTGIPVRRAADGRPIYNMEQDRINAINEDVYAVFEVADTPSPIDDGHFLLDWVTSDYAKAIVRKNSDVIEQLAAKYDVDPRLVKAIMFREQAAGGVQPAADSFGISSSLSPMGFNPEIWHGLGIDREAARDTENNIRAAVILISRIQDRLVEPTPEKIGTLYNGLMMEMVSKYGAQVARYYRERPWQENGKDASP